ncbi:MAG: major capsid protein [Bacteroidales bacterium]|nr:major capsid protein [Bacteroidales bacterium]
MNKSLFAEIVEKYFKIVIGKITEKFNGSKKESPLLHKTMLTEEYSADLTYGATELNNSVVAADVVAMDSPLPLKSRGSIKNASGKLPKLGVKYRKGEKDISDINIMRSRGTDEATIASKVMEDTPKCVKSMDVRKEIMFEQALSTGMTLVSGDETEEENDGTGVRVSFGYLDENTFHATVAPWGQSGYKPVDDIEQMFAKAMEDGNAINHVYLSKKYFNFIRSSEQGKKLVADFRGQIYTNIAHLTQPGRQAMLDALADEFGATFHIVDSSFKVEEHSGKKHSVRPWEEANLVGVPEEVVGRLVYGTLAEETNPVPGVSYQKSGSHVLISKYSKTDPLEEFTAAQALCLPVIDGGDSIYLLHADETDNFTVSKDEMTFTSAKGSDTATIHYDGVLGDLTITADEDFVTVSRRKNVLTVSVSANTGVGATERTATVSITDGTETLTIGVTQAAPAS